MPVSLGVRRPRKEKESVHLPKVVVGVVVVVVFNGVLKGLRCCFFHVFVIVGPKPASLLRGRSEESVGTSYSSNSSSGNK